MGCFESYMEFREEVDKVKKERGQKAIPQPTKGFSNYARIARIVIIPIIRILIVVWLISQTISPTSLLSSSGVIFAATSMTMGSSHQILDLLP